MRNKDLYPGAILARDGDDSGRLVEVVELLSNNRLKVRDFGKSAKPGTRETYSSGLRFARTEEIEGAK